MKFPAMATNLNKSASALKLGNHDAIDDRKIPI